MVAKNAHPTRILQILVLTLTITLSARAHADWRFEEIIRSGDPLRGPGTSDLVADQFALDHIFLDEQGGVAFRGWALDPGDPGFFGDGFWRVGSDGVALLMALEGTTLPGVPDLLLDFEDANMRYDASGRLVLGAGLIDDPIFPTIRDLALLEIAPDGTLEPVIVEGDPYPFSIPFFGPLTMGSWPGPFHAGRHLLTLQLREGIDQLSQTPLVSLEPDRSMTLHGTTREDPMPLVPGGFRLQAYQHTALNESGQFTVLITGDNGDTDPLAQGLYRHDPTGGWELIDFDTGFDVNLFELQVEHLTINANGTLAWVGRLPNFSGEGVWQARPGEAPELLLPLGGLLEGNHVAESFAGGIVLTNTDVVVTKVDFVGGGDGLYAAKSGGVVETIAVVGDPAPGIAGANYGGEFGIGGFTASADGFVAFTSGLDFDGGGPQSDALFAGSMASVDLIVMRGAQLETSEGERIRASTIRFTGSPYDNTLGEGFTGTGADGFPTVMRGGGQLLFELWDSGRDISALIVASRGITVNSVGDAEDLDPNDQLCDTGALTPEGDPECTLRAAIVQANFNPGRDRISFDIAGPAPYLIQPATPLPPITGPTDLEGPAFELLDPETQKRVSAPAVELDGQGMDAPGLLVGDPVVLKAGGLQEGEVRVDRLVIGGFREAIDVVRDETVVTRCSIGIRSDGTTFGWNPVGVNVDFASRCRIGLGPDAVGNQGNWILGHDIGILVKGDNAVLAQDNCIQGNVIGRADFVSPGTNRFGIVIENATGTLIGGGTAELGNLIAGNDSTGILVMGSSTEDTRILGNTIGTPSSSNVILGNGRSGIEVIDAIRTTIGGPTAISGTAPGNRICGNESGVRIHGITRRPKHTTVYGNLIGAASLARKVFDGNLQTGLLLANADSSWVGNGIAQHGNLISGNGGSGMRIEGTDLQQMQVLGNRIGMASDGASPVGNAVGITIELDGSLEGLGGGDVAVRVGGNLSEILSSGANLISGNQLDGIRVFGRRGLPVKIQGNWIGLDTSGTGIVGDGATSQENGIVLTNANRVQIGGGLAVFGNVISGHREAGIKIVGSAEIEVFANRIGPAADGESPLLMPPEQLHSNRVGILVETTSHTVQIGRDQSAGAAFYRNTIVGNEIGVQLDGDQNFVRNNSIGLGLNGRPFVSGRQYLGNQLAGIRVRGNFNTIGGPVEGERNHISGNSRAGGREDAGAIGLWIEGGAGFAPEGNLIFGNHIGVDPQGNVARNDIGIVLDANATKNRIGAATEDPSGDVVHAGETPGNVISGNRRGIWMRAGASENEVYGNLIGPAPNGGSLDPVLGSSTAQLEGVVIEGGASENKIGGLLAAQTNVISDNFLVGVRVRGSSTRSNRVSGNYVGTQPDPAIPLPNGEVGIYVSSGAPQTLIGWQADSAETAPDHVNIIRHHPDAGITTDGAIRPKIRLNRIEQNEVGVRLVSTQDASLTHNRFLDNKEGLVSDESISTADVWHEIYRDATGEGAAARLGSGKVNFVFNDFQVDAGPTMQVTVPSEAEVKNNNFGGAIAPEFSSNDPQQNFDLRTNYFSSTPAAEGFDTSEPLVDPWGLHATFGPQPEINLPVGPGIKLPLFIQSPSGTSRDVKLNLLDTGLWLDFPKTELVVTLDPEWGAVVEVPLQPNPTKDSHQETTIYVEASWLDDPSVVSTDTVTVRVYDPVLSSIVISEPEGSVAPGAVFHFVAAGLDQFEEYFATVILWSSEAGAIDTEGRWIAPETLGSYEITATDPGGTIVATILVVVDFGVGLPDDGAPGDDTPPEQLPRELLLQQNYPNPFNPQTTISFGLPHSTEVSLIVYNVRGERVRTLVHAATLEAGFHQLVWSGMDDRGARVSSGVYFYRLQADRRIISKKMLMVK